MYSLIANIAAALNISPDLVQLVSTPSVGTGAYGVYLGRDWTSYSGSMTPAQIDAEKKSIEEKIVDLMAFNESTWSSLGASLQGLYSPNLTATTTAMAPYPAPASGVSVGVAAVGFILAAILFIVVIIVWAKKKKLEENQIGANGNNSMAGDAGMMMSPGGGGPLGRPEMEMQRYQTGGGMMHARPNFDKNNLDPSI